jgi:hypothetical protein
MRIGNVGFIKMNELRGTVERSAQRFGAFAIGWHT